MPCENSLPSPVSERFVPRFTHGEPPSDAELAQFPALNASGLMPETAAMLAEEGRQLTNFAVRSNSPVTTLSRRFVHKATAPRPTAGTTRSVSPAAATGAQPVRAS